MILSKSAPKLATTLSPILKFLCTPRFTPQPPGPRRTFRLATAGLSNTSPPSGGGPNAFGSNSWSATWWLGSPVTTGLYAPPKSPTASIELVAIFPGPTNRKPLKQLSHTQNGVNPVPDFANIWKLVCQPPITVSVQLENELPNFRPRPTGKS